MRRMECSPPGQEYPCRARRTHAAHCNAPYDYPSSGIAAMSIIVLSMLHVTWQSQLSSNQSREVGRIIMRRMECSPPVQEYLCRARRTHAAHCNAPYDYPFSGIAVMSMIVASMLRIAWKSQLRLITLHRLLLPRQRPADNQRQA